MPNENEGGTPATTPAANDQLYGCDFDIETAKALNGKSIVAMVTNQTGTKMVAIAGQQGLSYNMSSETTEAATKDGSN